MDINLFCLIAVAILNAVKIYTSSGVGGGGLTDKMFQEQLVRRSDSCSRGYA